MSTFLREINSAVGGNELTQAPPPAKMQRDTFKLMTIVTLQ